MSYDSLGRLKSRTEPQPDGSLGTSTWGYDGANAIGKPTLVSGPNGYLRTGYYDALSRVVQTNSTLLTGIGTGEGAQYDAYGRVAKITYPTGLAVTHTYNARGYLTEVRNAATNALYWQIGDRDADQQLTREVLGNGLTTLHTYDVLGRAKGISTGAATTVQALTYSFDTLGNLKSRLDANQKTSETFTYDSLNRLTGASLSGQVGATPFQDPRSYAYDSLGNLTSKSDRGSYTYGTGSAGPHAVTATSGVAGGKGAATYTYDANGNQVSGDGRTITYTSFNVPSAITQGANTTRFTFDPDHARTSQVETTNGITKTTYYLHPRLDEGAHVEITVTGSLVEYTCFLYAGGKLIAQYHTQNDSSPAKLSYVHTDHLGSIDTLTSETGQVIERLSYDPFGQRRYPNGQSDPSHSLQGINTDYGFTQHEHLDGVGLIHMNGRVYDSSLGRFLSADPTVQYPESTQSYNRYSYVQNNPLSYTDPSGFGFFSSIFRAIGNVFRAIRQNFRTILAIGISFAIGNPYLAGFISGLISGGDLKSGIIGALSGGAFAAIGPVSGLGSLADVGKVLAKGVVGGIASVAEGGKFGAGFLSGGFGAAAGGYANNFVAAAVAGGIGSVLGGGKFANGAVTGAFARLASDVASSSTLADMAPPEVAEDGTLSADAETIRDRVKTIPPKVHDALVAYDAVNGSDGWKPDDIYNLSFNVKEGFYNGETANSSEITQATNQSGKITIYAGGMSASNGDRPRRIADTLIHEFRHSTSVNISMQTIQERQNPYFSISFEKDAMRFAKNVMKYYK